MQRVAKYSKVIVFLALASWMGCTTESGSGSEGEGLGGAGVAGASGGMAGTTALPTGGVGAEPVGGTGGVGGGAPAGAGGVGGIAGTGGVGGTAGVAGAAGIGGAGGVGGAAGVGGDSDGLIRGAEPTAASAAAVGPYTVVSTSMGLFDAPEYGSQTLHYPTDAEPPFASIAIVPGFVSPEDSIKPWGPFLASHGIVVLTIGTNTGGDSPELRSTALLAALDTLRAENERSGGPLEGKLDTDRFAVGGWSMGGGGTLLTANAHPELKAAMAICPWYLSQPFTMVTVPTLMFAGTLDNLAGGMSQGFYTAIPASTPKTIFEIAGADHYYANNPNGANNQVGRYGLSWLKVFLEGDERYRQFLTVSPTGASDFRTTVQ